MRFGDFLAVLSLIFITLKLFGVIDWSWWAVLSPIWVPMLIFVILASFIVVATHTRD